MQTCVAALRLPVRMSVERVSGWRGIRNQAQELLKIAAIYQEFEDKLAGYAEEVKTGLINGVKGEEW